MIRKLLLVLGSLVLAVILGGYLLPRQVEVERHVLVKQTPERLFAILNNMRRFNEWSPWHGRDPNTRYEFFGPEQGVGAGMRWFSEKPEVGQGAQVILASRPFEQVDVELDFGPEGKALAWYRLKPVEGGTRVSWAMRSTFGPNPAERYIGLVLDGLVGPDFEQGLNNLKALAEGRR